MGDAVIARRAFLTGLGASVLAAPSIVRAASLMPVRALSLEPVLGFSGLLVGAVRPGVLDMIDLDKALRHYLETINFPTAAIVSYPRAPLGGDFFS